MVFRKSWVEQQRFDMLLVVLGLQDTEIALRDSSIEYLFPLRNASSYETISVQDNDYHAWGGGACKCLSRGTEASCNCRLLTN